MCCQFWPWMAWLTAECNWSSCTESSSCACRRLRLWTGGCLLESPSRRSSSRARFLSATYLCYQKNQQVSRHFQTTRFRIAQFNINAWHITGILGTILATNHLTSAKSQIYTKSNCNQDKHKSLHKNKAFIDIRLRAGIAMPLAIWPTTATCDVVNKNGST